MCTSLPILKEVMHRRPPVGKFICTPSKSPVAKGAGPRSLEAHSHELIHRQWVKMSRWALGKEENLSVPSPMTEQPFLESILLTLVMEGARNDALNIVSLTNFLAGLPHPVGSPQCGQKQRKMHLGVWNVSTLMDSHHRHYT